MNVFQVLLDYLFVGRTIVVWFVVSMTGINEVYTCIIRSANITGFLGVPGSEK